MIALNHLKASWNNRNRTIMCTPKMFNYLLYAIRMRSSLPQKNCILLTDSHLFIPNILWYTLFQQTFSCLSWPSALTHAHHFIGLFPGEKWQKQTYYWKAKNVNNNNGVSLLGPILICNRPPPSLSAEFYFAQTDDSSTVGRKFEVHQTVSSLSCWETKNTFNTYIHTYTDTCKVV